MMDRFLVRAEVDLDAIAHNVSALKRLVGDRVAVMAVVKANAYGHGLEPVARTALESGASWLTLNHVAAGVSLRRAGIQAPILVMGYIPAVSACEIVTHDLTPTVTTQSLAFALSEEAQRTGKTIPIHVKVDTGMGRYGLAPEDVVDFARSVNRLPGLDIQGLYTHFATADSRESTYIHHQLALYHELLAQLAAEGIDITIRHTANSATTLFVPQARLDAVRTGIAIYGLSPSTEMPPPIPLQPALALKSRVGRVRTMPAGSSISYGCTFVLQRPTPVALIPCGYGDGYMRLTSNRGYVLIHGKRAPIRGRVCMDQLVVDVSGIDDVQLDDEVVLIGRQGDQVIKADDVAGWAETINYEIVTHLLPRVPRIYLRGGNIVSITEPWGY